MRDEVFRIGKSSSLFIEDEPYWLVQEVMQKRGYGYLVKSGTESTARLVSADNRERIWLLEPGRDRPRAAWAVNEAGRSELHEMYPRRTQVQRRRRRRSPLPTVVPGFNPPA